MFLDEVNTSSCLGLFKEIIVDRSFDGEVASSYSTCILISPNCLLFFPQPIPENVFIVAACNPHRGNSLASHTGETWVRGNYNVRPLHPTLKFLKWDYGSLDENQERDYIKAKLKMINEKMPNSEVKINENLIIIYLMYFSDW